MFQKAYITPNHNTILHSIIILKVSTLLCGKVSSLLLHATRHNDIRREGWKISLCSLLHAASVIIISHIISYIHQFHKFRQLHQFHQFQSFSSTWTFHSFILHSLQRFTFQTGSAMTHHMVEYSSTMRPSKISFNIHSIQAHTYTPYGGIFFHALRINYTLCM